MLAAWLSATLEPDLAATIPEPAERRVIAETIIASANPRAHVAEMVPARPIVQPDTLPAVSIANLAEADFVQGIRLALLIATASLALAFLAGWRWFPRGVGAMVKDAEREAEMAARADR